MSIYDVVPTEGHANIKAAQTTAAMRRLNRQMDAVAQRLADLRGPRRSAGESGVGEDGDVHHYGDRRHRRRCGVGSQKPHGGNSGKPRFLACFLSS